MLFRSYLTDVTLNITGNSNNRDCMLATFYSCANLQNVYFPGKFLGSNQVFVSCSKLKKIIIDSPTPSEIYSNTFNPLPSACRIYVPDESVDLYKEAEVWSTYASQILGQSQLNS